MRQTFYRIVLWPCLLLLPIIWGSGESPTTINTIKTMFFRRLVHASYEYATTYVLRSTQVSYAVLQKWMSNKFLEATADVIYEMVKVPPVICANGADAPPKMWSGLLTTMTTTVGCQICRARVNGTLLFETLIGGGHKTGVLCNFWKAKKIAWWRFVHVHVLWTFLLFSCSHICPKGWLEGQSFGFPCVMWTLRGV